KNSASSPIRVASTTLPPVRTKRAGRSSVRGATPAGRSCATAGAAAVQTASAAAARPRIRTAGSERSVDREALHVPTDDRIDPDLGLSDPELPGQDGLVLFVRRG